MMNSLFQKIICNNKHKSAGRLLTFILIMALLFALDMATAAEPQAIEEELRLLRQQAQQMRIQADLMWQRSEQTLKRIKQLEQQQGITQSPAQVSITTPPVDLPQAIDSAGEAAEPHGKGVLELKSGDTVLSIGGRIAMDSTFSQPDGSFSPRSVPLDDSGENSQFSAHARNSRLWLKTRTPTLFGQLQTLVEVDFWGSSGTETISNSHNPRLRHAYFQVGGVTAGQTWSTFTSYVTPDTILDSAYINWIRQAQLRWSHDADGLGYDVSLENPETTLTDSFGNKIEPDDDRLPDLVARLRLQRDWGEASASLLLREIRQDRALLSDGVTRLDSSDQALGWGLGASAKFNIHKMDDLRLSLIFGEGVGRYMAANAFNAGSVDSQGDIDPIRSWGGFASYRHWWNENWRSNLLYSRVEADNHTSITGSDVNKSADSFIANLFWTPIENGLVGLEYGHIERELENGQSGDMDQVYLRLLYNF